MNFKDKEELYKKLKAAVMDELEDTGINETILINTIDKVIDTEWEKTLLSLSDRLELREALKNSFNGLDILQKLLDDRSVTEIMINGYRDIFIEKNGRIKKCSLCFESEEKLEDIIQQIVSRINRRVNTSSPIVDARLEDGSRVHIVLAPIALNGPIVTIRKFPEVLDMRRLIESGTVSKEAAEDLKTLVSAGYNIFISGGTSSGKSTFLNALSQYIPSDERVITIEDSAELQIRHVDNLVSLETRDANTEGNGKISMSELIKASLRMRPDRIIIGEVRGPEALDMLSAMNTGHDGSLSTGHANSTKDMLTRLESMVLMAVELPLSAIKNQIAAGIDILVHLTRLPDKSRRVTEISEVKAYENGEIILNKLYSYDFDENNLKKTGEIENREKLVRKGLIL